MKIFGDLGSGNCLKVKYTADHLGLPYTWVPIDIMKGETHTPEFLSGSPGAAFPAVEFDDGRRLAESNAIIRYLARGSALLPRRCLHPGQDRRVAVLGAVQPRALHRHHALSHRLSEAVARPARAWRVERGEKALDFMEPAGGPAWLVGET